MAKIRHIVNSAIISVPATERHTMALKKYCNLSLKMNCNLKVKNYINYKALPANMIPMETECGGAGFGSRSTNREPSTGRDKAPVLFIYFVTASTIVTAEVYQVRSH